MKTRALSREEKEQLCIAKSNELQRIWKNPIDPNYDERAEMRKLSDQRLDELIGETVAQIRFEKTLAVIAMIFKVALVLFVGLGVIGLLLDAGKWDLAGTAFCYASPDIMLTAAHCVQGFPAERVGYSHPSGDRIVPAAAIEAHPSADIAIVRVPRSDAGLTGFWGYVANYGLGEEFMTYGFPYEELGGGLKRLLPRLFIGHYQRFFDYVHGPWRYRAGEMSVPSPLGLSGAPIIRPRAEQMLTGIVTANVSSELVEDYYEETETDGRKVVHKTARITTYGIALMLDSIADWLKPRLPNPDAHPRVWE